MEQQTSVVACEHDILVMDDAVSPPAKILPEMMSPCGKFWYKSKDDAERTMRKMKSDPVRVAQGYILNAFYCHGCDGYHVGHTRK